MQFQVGQRVILKHHEVWPELTGREGVVIHAAESATSNEGRKIGEHYALRIDGRTDVGAWPDMLEGAGNLL